MNRQTSYHLPWIIFAGAAIFLLFAIGYLYWNNQQQLFSQQALIENQVSREAVFLQEYLLPSIHDGNWMATGERIQEQQRSLPGSVIVIIDRDLNVVAGAGQPHAQSIENVQRLAAAGATQPVRWWISPRQTLAVAAPLAGSTGDATHYLVYETNQEQFFQNQSQEQAKQALVFLLTSLGLLAITGLAVHYLYAKPFQRIYRLSLEVSRAIQGTSAQPASVDELRQIDSALSSTLQVLSNQQVTLEQASDSLEDAIGVRTQLARDLIEQSERLNRTLTKVEVITTIGEGAVALSQANGLAIFIRGEDSADCSCAWSYQLADEQIHSFIAFRKAVPFPETGKSPIPVLIADLQQLGPQSSWFHMPNPAGFRAVQVWPIVYEGKINAFVVCFYQHPHEVTKGEQEILETFFRQASVALENARLFEAETTQRRLAEALIQISAKLNSTLDLNKVLESILDSLGQVVSHDTADIMLLDNDCLRMVRWSGISEKLKWPVEEWLYPISDFPVIQKIQETAGFVVVPYTEQEIHWVQLPHSTWIRSYAGAPIIQRGAVTGFINVNSSIPGFYNQETGQILQAFANQAAIALENAGLYKNASQGFAEASALYRAMQPLFNPSGDLVSLAQQITRSIIEEFASAHCSILLADEKKEFLEMVAQYGDMHLNSPRLALNGPGLTVSAYHTGNVVYAPDVSKDPKYLAGTIQSRSELAIPLRAGNRVIGVLNLESPIINAFDENARLLLESFAERAALSLENSRLFATIRQQASQMKQLNEITHTALQTSNSQQMLNLLTRQVATMLNADGCYITLWDGAENKTYPLAAYGPNEEIYRQIEPKPDEMTLTNSALRLGHALVVEEVSNSPYISAELATDYPIRSILTLPMIADGQKIGGVLVGFVQPHTFLQEEISLGEQAAAQIALAMSKLRLLEIAQRRAQEANNLRLATSALGSTLDQHQVLDRILTHLEQVIQHDSACIFLLEGPNHYRVWAAKNIAQIDEVLNLHFPRTDALLQEVEQTLHPLTISDASSDSRFHGWGGTSSIKSWMGMPLVARSEFVGILTLDRNTINDFKHEEIELAQVFANQAAVAVQNARLYQATQQRARELEALHTATTSLVSTLDLQKLLERILAAATSAIPTATSAVLHLLDDLGQMEMRVQQGLSEEERTLTGWDDEKSLWGWVLRERRPLMVGSPTALPAGLNRGFLGNNGSHSSIMIAPLFKEDQVLGALTLTSPEENAFTEPNLQLLISFASTATAAIHNAQLHSAVQYLAITDPLTGVYNRRGFYNLAGHILDQSRYFHRPLSAIMVDIDYFKRINDQHGHDAGDAVLQELAARFRKVLRESDLICRYGGEEFAILITESDLDGAEAAAHRLHRIITETPVQTTSGPVSVTMSIGVATFTDRCSILDDLLKLADKALYIAKEEGRNRVHVWKE